VHSDVLAAAAAAMRALVQMSFTDVSGAKMTSTCKPGLNVHVARPATLSCSPSPRRLEGRLAELNFHRLSCEQRINCFRDLARNIDKVESVPSLVNVLLLNLP
jgi:hypothetical protein